MIKKRKPYLDWLEVSAEYKMIFWLVCLQSLQLSPSLEESYEELRAADQHQNSDWILNSKIREDTKSI